MPKKYAHSKKRPRRTDKTTDKAKVEKIEKAVVKDVEKRVEKLARAEVLARARESKLANLEERYRIKGINFIFLIYKANNLFNICISGCISTDSVLKWSG